MRNPNYYRCPCPRAVRLLKEVHASRHSNSLTPPTQSLGEDRNARKPMSCLNDMAPFDFCVHHRKNSSKKKQNTSVGNTASSNFLFKVQECYIKNV